MNSILRRRVCGFVYVSRVPEMHGAKLQETRLKSVLFSKSQTSRNQPVIFVGLRNLSRALRRKLKISEISSEVLRKKLCGYNVSGQRHGSTQSSRIRTGAKASILPAPDNLADLRSLSWTRRKTPMTRVRASIRPSLLKERQQIRSG